MSRSKRLAIWLIANIAFLLLMAIGAAQHGGDERVLYVSALFALCSTPILCLDRLNGRYVLLSVLAPFYFVLFGMLDVLGVLFGAYPASTAPGAQSAEWGILSGMVCILLGYFAGVRLGSTRGPARSVVDWPESYILPVGLALWLAGSVAILYLQLFVITEKTAEATRRGMASLGPVLTFVVMLGTLVAPLGMLMLTYGYARFRRALWLVMVVTLILGQLMIGFVIDVRGIALLPPVLVVIALTLLDNKVPKAWLLTLLVLLTVLFPILSAYRTAISGDRGLSREQAAQNLSKVIDVVLAYADKDAERSGQVFGRSSLFERLSIKENVEHVFTHTGIDVPFQNGRTLAPIPLAFVPRLVLPDKVDVPTGVLFNHTFYRGEDDTYISPSHLGELYWNFGWSGLVLGTLLIGTVLGFIATKCDMSEHASLTRLLVLLATVQYLCLGFEGAMAVSYISWLRSLGAIGILHLLFARTAAGRRQESEPSAPITIAPQPLAVTRFPNMMR
jgi:hypothetical protein